MQSCCQQRSAYIASGVYTRTNVKLSPQMQPVYEALLELAMSLGDDVKADPDEAAVHLKRNRVFARIKPITRKSSGRS